MKTEYEATFVLEDAENFAAKILQLGGNQVHERFLMERKTFDIPGAARGTFVRVRREATQITMTLKVNKELSIAGTEEAEVVVDDFNKAAAFATGLGLKQATFEQTYRTTFTLGVVEVTIDEWPGIPPVTDIEGPTQDAVESAAELLGLNMQDAHFGPIDTVYQKFGIDISSCTEITFEAPPQK